MRKLIAKLAARLTRGGTPVDPPRGWKYVGADWARDHVNCRSVIVRLDDGPAPEPAAKQAGEQEPPPPQVAKPKTPAKASRSPFGPHGRGIFGSGLDPSRIPPDARTAHWEAKHLFSPYGRLPTRHAHGVQVPEPPLAMVCPECDARRPAMGAGQVAECEYCGVTIVVWGSLIHWWYVEEVDVEPWVPKAIEP